MLTAIGGEHSVWSTVINGVRFEEPVESQFRRSFTDMGRKSRHEMWAILLVVITSGILFHHTLLRVPPEVLPLGRTLLVAVAIPMVLRWLSGDRSPLWKFSSAFYILSVYIDVACLMVLRIACIRHGLDVVPLVMPVAILMSLIVVQIRFVLLAPAILVGLAGIVVTELRAFATTSNQLFDVAASIALVTVALSAAYELERSTRIAWLRGRELGELTRTDPLTGVPNRRYFDDRLAELTSTAQRTGRSLAVMVLDVDGFKAFNDHHGHLSGDECLRRIGAYLAQTMRGPDEFCARLGGEEFVVVWCADASDVAVRAEDIRSGIATLSIPAAEDGQVVTASAGLVEDRAPGPSSTVGTELLRHADSALYRAKRGGRDQLVVATDEIPVISSRGRVEAGRAPAPPTATVLQPAPMTPSREAEFRAAFDRQGRITRAAIMLGLDAVCVAIMLVRHRLLRIPPAAVSLGTHTLVSGIMPAATLAAVTALVPRLQRWSAPTFIAAVAVITSAQMLERAQQLPHGYDVVPYLMPTAVLLSMSVVKIRFGVLAPSTLAILLCVSAIELWVFPWTSNRLLTVGVCALTVVITTRFAYKLERSVRLAWLEERKLDELTRADPLTGLANRRSLDEALVALDGAAGPLRAAVMILDIDDFKGFNDRYGHPAGDEALRAIGAYLQCATAGQKVLVARIGGEEFAALWSDGSDASTRRAEALRAGIAALGPLAGTPSTLTASAGFAAASPVAGWSAQDLLAHADHALYEAKGCGRDQLVEVAPETARQPKPPVRYE